jgi:hypothetical protein
VSNFNRETKPLWKLAQPFPEAYEKLFSSNVMDALAPKKRSATDTTGCDVPGTFPTISALWARHSGGLSQL